MRGRLILPFLAEVRRLDTAATAADPDGAGPQTAGYDDDFREPVLLPAPAGAGGPGTVHRVERAPLLLPCQVEVGSAEKRQMFFAGNSPDSRLVLVCHMRDLEARGLVDAQGRVALGREDRLTAIFDTAGALVRTLPTPLFASQVEPAEYGLGRKQNLLLIYFEEREKGAPA